MTHLSVIQSYGIVDILYLFMPPFSIDNLPSNVSSVNVYCCYVNAMPIWKQYLGDLGVHCDVYAIHLDKKSI